MRLNENHWLLTKPVAHRGLWNDNVTENSLSAYENAVANGYPIEIDVYSSKDGVLYSFHDATLSRMTGEDGYIYDKTSEELSSLKLAGGNEGIPTFEQVLTLCENKTPLLIEIKNQPDKKIVERVVNRLKNYTGEFAVQSFNPLYINKVKKLAPEFIRGILGTPNEKTQSKLTYRVISKLPLNFLIKPDFISYDFRALPLPKKIKKNIHVIAWTVTDPETAEKIKPFAENIIFEKFVP